MTNYIAFINAMNDMQKMKLQAAIAREEAKRADMAAIGQGISQLGSSFADAITQQKANETANQIMNETMAPSTGNRFSLGINPNATPGATPRRYTGGVNELKMRMMAQDLKSQGLRDDLDTRGMNYEGDRLKISQDELQLERDKLEALKEHRRTIEAQKDFSRVGMKPKDAFNAAKSYYSGMRKSQIDLQKATTPEEYESISDNMMSFYHMADNAGLKVDPPTIPPFVSPEQRIAITDQQNRVNAAEKKLQTMQNDYIPNWAGGDEKQAATLAAEKQKLETLPGYNTKPSAIPQIQGYPEGGPEPADEGEPASYDAGQALAPEGTKVKMPDGSIRIKRNGQWVPIE